MWRWTAASVVVLAGCFGGDGSEGVSETLPDLSTTTSSTTSTTTPESMMEAAQVRYFELAAAYNVAVSGLWANGPAVGDWAALPPVCAQLAQLNETFAAGLTEYGAWPSDAQDDIAALAAETGEAVDLYSECAGLADPTLIASLDVRMQDVEFRSSQAAASARLALGLPVDPCQDVNCNRDR